MVGILQQSDYNSDVNHVMYKLTQNPAVHGPKAKYSLHWKPMNLFTNRIACVHMHKSCYPG